jgi:FG-GAP-like repeat
MYQLVHTRSRLLARPPTDAFRAAAFALVVASLFGVCGLLIAPGSAHAASTGLQFEPQLEYPTGKPPEGIAAGDLTGDGKPDLVTADKEANAVSVLINKGNGTFQAPSEYSTGVGPDAVALADLTGNGKLDIVTANGTGKSVSVLLGNGDGSFQAQAEFPAGADPVAVAVADLGNGHPDIVVADKEGNTVGVLLGKGDGTFEPLKQFSTGGEKPEGVAVANLGNGTADIVATNAATNNVSVLVGKGDGTFAEPATTYSLGLGPSGTGTAPVGVALADLKGNGIQDIVTANEKAGTVSVLLGKGDGTFEEPKEFKAGKKSRAVAISDLSDDGKPDIATANASSEANSVSVLLGKGDGTFAGRQEFPTGKEPKALVLADFNGDGKPDIATANSGASSASVLIDNNIGVLSASPSSLTFAPQLFGTRSAAQTVTVTNTGAAPMTVSGVTLGGKAPASFAASGCAGASLAVNASCSVTLTFKPSGEKGYGELKAEATVATSVGTKVLKLVGTGLPPAAIVKTEPVSEVVGPYATLSGKVLSQGAGEFWFEYGPTTAYGKVTPKLPLSSSFSAQLLSATLLLAPGRYHYRIVAQNLAGTVYGSDQKFAIAPEGPLLRLLKHGHLAAVLARGLRLRLSEGSPVIVTVKLQIAAATARAAHLASSKTKRNAKVTVGSARVVLGAAAKTITLHFSANARRKLAGLRHLKLAIVATPSTHDGVVGEIARITASLNS